VLSACSELRQAIHNLIQAPLCDGELGAVIARLEAYCSRHTPEQGAHLKTREATPALTAVVEAAILDEPSSPVASEPAASHPKSSPPAPSFARRASDYAQDTTTIQVSPALFQFMCKLQAFERLIEQGSPAKAAIVALDIRSVIAAFDPMVYLPGLLAPHFRLLSAHIADLSPHWEMNGTPAWMALEQLYRVDLEAFVEA
jgi:hypothetical protein